MDRISNTFNNKGNGSKGLMTVRILNKIMAFVVICGFWVAGQAITVPNNKVYANILQFASMPVWFTTYHDANCNNSSYCSSCYSDPENTENYYNIDCDCTGYWNCCDDCDDGRCTTSGEDNYYFTSTNFPNLQSKKPLCVIGEPDSSYNCLAWAKEESGYQDFPLPLDSNITNFAIDGYVAADGESDATIAIYYRDSTANDDVYHFARKVNGVWTSKCGTGPIIKHTLGDLENPSHYGDEQYFMKNP